MLKRFIWLLRFHRSMDGVPLVALLAGIEWKPRPHPMAILKPAAAHLEEATSGEGASARDRLLAEIRAAEAR